MNVRAGRFPLFDSLRALAALSVVAFHAAFFAGMPLSDSVLRPFTAHLDVGVTLFFLISGFLLYRPFVRARLRDERPPHAGAYAWRRLLRIGPAYWVALTVVAIWLGLWNVFTASGIPTYYGFAQIYSYESAGGGIGQAWTLCVEVTFYAFLPLWALLMRRSGASGRRSQVLAGELVALGVLFALSLGYKVFALQQVSPNDLRSPPWLMPLPNFLDQFALGMALAVLSAWYEDRPLPRPIAVLVRFPALPWIASALAFWAVSTQIGFTGEHLQQYSGLMFLERHQLYSLVALGMLLPAVFGDQARGAVRWLLARPVLLYLGLISYGIYLYHFAAIDSLAGLLGDADDPNPGWRFAGYLALGSVAAAAIASLSYYLVERPALSLKGRVGPRPEPRRDEAIAEPAPAGPAAASRG